METKLICTILSGRTSSFEKTERTARAFKDCPYVYFMATEKNHLYAVMFLTEPRAQTWIENQRRNPKTIFGLEKAKVTIANNVQFPRQLKPRLPKQPLKRTPCGLNCAECPAYERCSGCPATTFYKKAKPAHA